MESTGSYTSNELKPQEKKVLQFVIDFQRKNNGLPPSHRQISEECGWSGPSTSYRWVQFLVEKGWLEMRNGKVIAKGGIWLPPLRLPEGILDLPPFPDTVQKTCKCGLTLIFKVGVGDKQQCECGEWWYYDPGFRLWGTEAMRYAGMIE
jgi:hypothetical protein